MKRHRLIHNKHNGEGSEMTRGRGGGGGGGGGGGVTMEVAEIGETQSENHFKLQHPFTMMISGPTSCGKTTLVKHILSNNFIQPKLQRIVWLYKRWQPLYDVIKSNVWPLVEFIQGIPIDLENDEFFDPNINNLVVLDDLASVAGKDSRITDLFTEGSHHRNLSVISINQNIFSSKDPTQRRNCLYMVMFNNPVDKQQLMILARQMYPTQSNYFINEFNKAVREPRGYMLIDLQPLTLERDRLNPNVFDKIVKHIGLELLNQQKDITSETCK